MDEVKEFKNSPLYKQRKRHRLKRWTTVQTICFIFLVIYALCLLGMYVWGFFTSLKSNSDFRHNLFGLPSGHIWEWKWDNYITAFSEVSVPASDGISKVYLPTMLLNTVLYSFLGAFLSTFSTWLVAYALAKFKYKFSNFLYRLIMIMMVIPIVGSLPSALHLYREVLGLYDSWAYIIVINITINASTMLIFYAYFLGIGNEYTEAAKIDGAGNFTILMKIMFPLTAQMFLIMFIQAFIPLWNDYMSTVIWFPSIPTLAYGIFKFTDSTTTAANWPPIQVAGCIILMIPLLVLFLAFKDKLIGNIRMGGVKM